MEESKASAATRDDILEQQVTGKLLSYNSIEETPVE